MRHTNPRDEGVAAVYVAIALFLIFGAGAIAVDAGMMWTERRNLVADVDSATLAAAEVQADDTCPSPFNTWVPVTSGPVYEAAVDMLTRNRGEAPDAAAITVERWCSASDTGKVRVGFTGQVQPLFSALYGFSDLNVHNEAVAGVVPFGTGLRPLSVCVDDGSASVDTPIERWLAGGPGTKLTTSTEKTWNDPDTGTSSNCGTGSSGSWGWVCFDKSPVINNTCNTPSLNQLLVNGWAYDVKIGAPPEDCSTDPFSPGPCPPYNDSPTNPGPPYSGWADYDCKIGSPNDMGDNDGCDVHTGNAGSTQQDALDDLNCDLGDDGSLLASPPAIADCGDKVFPILGVWEITGSGSGGILKPSAYVVVTFRHPTFLAKNHKLTGDNTQGKVYCEERLEDIGDTTGWITDPAPGNNENETCVTFELLAVHYTGTLADLELVGKDVRLCGVAGNAGATLDYC